MALLVIELLLGGLQRLPDERTLSRWLAGISGLRERLNGLLREIAYATFSSCKLGRTTLDFDGTVTRAGDQVDGAERGFGASILITRRTAPTTR